MQEINPMHTEYHYRVLLSLPPGRFSPLLPRPPHTLARPSPQAVAAFVRASCKQSEPFLKHLTAAVVKQAAPGGPVRLSRHQAHVLILWSCSALEVLDPISAKKAVAKLV